jgi:NTP pyrophosphatase (non-canonical NTP hydrolase)
MKRPFTFSEFNHFVMSNIYPKASTFRNFQLHLEDLILEHPHHLIHSAMGLATESAEILEIIKRRVFISPNSCSSSSSLDTNALIKELGDLLFYAALLANTLGTNLESIIENLLIDEHTYGIPNDYMR